MALRAVEPEMTFPEAIRAALKELGWEPKHLHARYIVAGGSKADSTFDNYLAGDSIPQMYDYDVIAKVLNEALEEERFPRLPFGNPLLRGRDSNPQPSVFKPERVAA